MRDFDNVQRVTWRRARGLRRTMSVPERILWSKLRNGQLGARFRRQHAIGDYIVDFVALESRLVVELDGRTHFSPEEIEHDRQRTEFLNELDYRVIRFTNRDVTSSLDGVLAAIQRSLDTK